jgi:hypothetical protein
MRIKFVYRIFPVFIFYYKGKENKTYDATTFFNIIFIREKYRDNEAILQHEITHARQFYRTCGLHFFLYLLSPKYRLYSEIEAIKVQLKFMITGYRYSVIAKYIFENYGIEMIMTQDEIEELLKE